MEIFLAIVAIVFFAIILKVINDRFSALEYRLHDMTRAFENLKKTVEEQPREPVQPKSDVQPVAVPPPTVQEQKPVEKPASQEIPVVPLPEPEKIPERKTAVAEASIDAPKPEPKPAYIPYEPEKSWWEKFKEQNPDLEKFIGENLINKIGILILVLGISYFVKFAIDKDWINEPARVGVGILAGSLVMFFAHRLRKEYAPFSSVLVAGAISIFYFTIGIAFHDYHLFGQTTAFVIMVVITTLSCLVSLSYDRIELAVLSLIGGFAVPFMVSTGQGNYIALFTYIAILDIGILALAYRKKWHLINVLSYVFTIVLFGVWLYGDLRETAPHYTGALIFATIFYLIFVLISIVNNLRTKGIFSTIELGILTSNTFLFYAAGMAVLTPFHPELKGLFTTVLAILNLSYAWILYKKFGLDKTAVYLLIGLTLTFATLAIPIQFSGHYITLFWAAEAALLMWLGQKSGMVSYRFASVVVHALAGISLLMDWRNEYDGQELMLLGNPAFITGISVVASLIVVTRMLKNDDGQYRQFAVNFIPQDYRKFTLIAAVVLGYFVGLVETYYQADKSLVVSNSARAVPMLYHLLFCAVVVFFMLRLKNRIGITVAAVLSAVNVVLFAFAVLGNAFSEHQYVIAYGNAPRIAFWLHYASLAAAIYFAVQLYRIRAGQDFKMFGNVFFSWIFAFFIVYIASGELLLHTQTLSNTPVEKAEIVARANDSFGYDAVRDEHFLRMLSADEKINAVTTQVVKTGFPILWGVLAFAFLIFGIKKPSKPMRIIALALLGITILKLFVFDIRNASQAGKIVAFILLGVLILVISFVYQKLKVLVIDDKKENPDEAQ